MDKCDLCESEKLNPVYPVPGTARGLTVNVCEDCGLVQSLPRIDHVPRRSAFPDARAGFGNIRYGKGFRTEFALKKIAEQRPLESFKHCLDVGANRGSFILSLLQKAPKLKVDAVEPDGRVLDDYSDHAAITVINERIENVQLENDKYDLIYHCHTLEHEAHPVQSLKALHAAMTDDGIMFLEVPNIAFLQQADVVEEWFIDKHLYHYSIDSLVATVEAAGFNVLEHPNKDDHTNISVILRKGEASDETADGEHAEQVKSLIHAYAQNLINNQKKLQFGAERLMQRCEKERVVIWGAGRIFASLCDIGKFDPNHLAGVVDKNIYKYVDEMFGVPIEHPSKISKMNPAVVLVASRLYLDEIRAELEQHVTGVKVLTLDDVLNGELEAAA